MARRILCSLCALGLVVLVLVSFSTAQVKVGGYLQAWELSQQTLAVAGHPGIDSSDNGFRIRRARLNFKADLNEVFSIDSWLELAGSTNILLDFKGIAKVAPEFVVTVGQFIPPVHMHETANISSSRIPFYELSDVAINLSTFMGTDSYRDIGLMVGGQYDVVRYGVYYGNGRGRFNSVLPGSSTAGTILNRKFGQGLYGGRIDVEPVKGLYLGGHVSMNKQDSILVAGTATPIQMDRSSYSFGFGADGLEAIPELYADVAYGNGKVNDPNAVTAAKNGFDYNGMTAIVGYKILPTLQLLGRYDTYTQNNNAIVNASGAVTTAAATTKAKNWTFGATLYFFKEKTELVKVGINYESRKEEPTDVRNNIFVIWTQFKM